MLWMLILWSVRSGCWIVSFGNFRCLGFSLVAESVKMGVPTPRPVLPCTLALNSKGGFLLLRSVV